MRLVPMIDSSGVHALASLIERCRRKGITLIISGLQPQPQRVLAQMASLPADASVHQVEGFEAALELAQELARAPTS